MSTHLTEMVAGPQGLDGQRLTFTGGEVGGNLALQDQAKKGKGLPRRDDNLTGGVGRDLGLFLDGLCHLLRERSKNLPACQQL
jgi:hypothetical protein